MNGDSQLVKMWFSFLLHNHWMEKNELGELKVTDKGNAMLQTYLLEGSLGKRTE